MSIKTWVKELVVDVIADERTQTALTNIVGELITTRILPLVPVAASAAATAAVNELIKQVPELHGVADIAKVGDEVRTALNDLIPDIDFGIPALDQLIDFWRPKQG